MEHPGRILVPTIIMSLMLVALPAMVDYVPDDHRGVLDGGLAHLDAGHYEDALTRFEHAESAAGTNADRRIARALQVEAMLKAGKSVFVLDVQG